MELEVQNRAKQIKIRNIARLAGVLDGRADRKLHNRWNVSENTGEPYGTRP